MTYKRGFAFGFLSIGLVAMLGSIGIVINDLYFGLGKDWPVFLVVFVIGSLYWFHGYRMYKATPLSMINLGEIGVLLVTTVILLAIVISTD